MPLNSKSTLQAPRTIDPQLLYRADDLRRLLGWKETAWRAAVRRGLRAYRSGRRNYVLGRDVIEYLTQPGNLIGPGGVKINAESC